MVDKNMSDFADCWFAMGVLVLMVVSTNAFLVDLTLVEDAVAKGAVCLDGSPPGYHLSKGFGSGVNNWLVHFEGGSWCNNITTCSARTKTRLGSSKYMSKQVQFSGLLGNSKAKNPVVVADQFNNMAAIVDGESSQLGSQRRTAATAAPTATPTTVVLDVPGNETVADLISAMEYWNKQISEVQADYNNLGDAIYKTFTISVGFQGAIVSAMFSCARQIKESLGCDWWWNRLILSALLLSTLVSTATIVVVLFEFVQQFKLLELERHCQQERNSVLDNCVQHGRLTRSRRFVVSNYRRGFAVSGHRTDSSYWWLLRFALMLIFFVFSACIFVTWTHLRCPSHF